MSLNTLTLKSYISKVAKKEISPNEVAHAISQEIDAKNADLNIYLARNEQVEQDQEQASSAPLAGAPIAVKDNFLTAGLTTTASAKVLDGFVPPYSATVMTKLAQAGGVVIGKTNMDAWAHGSSTETSDYGVTKNPRNPEHLPGGSSGGSAAAVAAEQCIAAIGSETAGSIRQPAAWCGVVGLKPTYGRCSRYGVVAMGSSLDCPGPMGKTVEDCALLLTAIAGHDPYDGTTSTQPVPDFSSFLVPEDKLETKPLMGMKIAVAYSDVENIPTVTRKALTQAAAVFEQLGATVTILATSEALEPGKVLHPTHAIGVYTVVQRSEVSSNLARYDGVRYGHDRSNFGEEARRRIMLGTFTLSKGYADQYYTKAQKVRTLYAQNYQDLFSSYDLIIAPTSPHYALKVGATKDNPMFGELEDMLVEPSSISGLPGINVPMGYHAATNLYLGLNLIAPMWQEGRLITAAHAFTRNSTFTNESEATRTYNPQDHEIVWKN